VKVGVVLVSWQGAENAGTNTRPKADALTKAQELAAVAKTDFRRAVTQGDPGSAEDIGRIPRGTLDPRTEAVLFTLPSGEVSDVIETKRGFWIVKRLD
jgi:parvulin-like peptidyl-prolyl isomerase